MIVDFNKFHTSVAYTDIVEIVDIFSFVLGNLLYGLTFIITSRNAIKYNQFLREILKSFKYKQKFKHLSTQTNCLTIGYNVTLIVSGFLWHETVTLETFYIQIIYMWFFTGNTLAIVYIRYITEISLELFDEIILKYDKGISECEIKWEILLSGTDTCYRLKEMYQKIFVSQLTLNVFNSFVEISMTLFSIILLGQRGTIMEMILGLFFYTFPPVSVFFIYVNSINKFGKQVNVYYFYFFHSEFKF